MKLNGKIISYNPFHGFGYIAADRDDKNEIFRFEKSQLKEDPTPTQGGIFSWLFASKNRLWDKRVRFIGLFSGHIFEATEVEVIS